MRRVAITGVGAVTPLGNDAQATWDGALSGRSGIDEIRAFDAGAYPVSIAGEVKDFDPSGLASPKELRRLDRNVLFALSAAKEALADAGVNGYDPGRMGVVVGSGIGGLNQVMEQYEIPRERGPDRGSPTPCSRGAPRRASTPSSSPASPLCAASPPPTGIRPRPRVPSTRRARAS